MSRRHQPNLKISQWFQQVGFKTPAGSAEPKCSSRQDLPWTEDAMPNFDDNQEMVAVCQGCPILVQCAGFALRADGGFYAGVWVPWKSTEKIDGDNASRLRSRARLHLNRIASITTALA